MFDPQKLLDQFLGGGQAGDGLRKGISPETLKGLAGGAAAGGLAAVLLGSKGGRKIAETALKVGGTAVVAGLAYKAWQNWQASKGAQSTVPVEPMKDLTPKAEGTPFLPAPKAQRDTVSLAILSAMIAAAKADGHIDASEQQRIFGRLDEMALDTEAKAYVMDELRKPLDIDAVVAKATSLEVAAEIYAASLLAIDPDDPAEQGYLAMLASRLKLDAGLKLSIEQEARKVLA
jgi:uncharacterized membrane protein YebE (DUF533 family)